ncbi:uncharacterized protein [Hetaerina americana]|uniref:uncharacterized protein n=1 Tax=Hetaerina americana TaxID=62018 RepID=UPI003A7F314F
MRGPSAGHLVLVAMLLLARGHCPTWASPIGGGAAADDEPQVISTGNPQQGVIIDVPPTVDAAGATDTTREEVESAGGSQWSGRASEGANEVPVRQSALEVAVASKLRSECARREPSACLKLKLLAYMNKLLKKASIPLTDAVEISQTSEVAEEEWEEARRGVEGVEEDEALGLVVAEKVAAFVRTRSLRWTLLPEADLLLTPNADPEGTVSVGVSVRAGRAVSEMGRGKLKQLLPILAAVKIKIGILVALAIAGLALLVGKAVVISKLALLLAGILGLIKLLSRPHKSVTYEVVSHPHHTYSHGSSTVVEAGHHHHESYPGTGYGRSFDGGDLAYRAHAGNDAPEEPPKSR